ncbi:MAG: hypothetical protein IKO27_07395 [Ruminococcus sp.]|nr:hypothetical protein [Ruminococcus sp.]
MKRLEIFEYGIFLTLLTEDGRIYMTEPSGDHYSPSDKAEPFPVLGSEPECGLTYVSYNDTGDQTGRIITVTQRGSSLEALTFFRFYKGLPQLDISSVITNNGSRPYLLTLRGGTVSLSPGESFETAPERYTSKLIKEVL